MIVDSHICVSTWLHSILLLTQIAFAKATTLIPQGYFCWREFKQHNKCRVDKSEMRRGVIIYLLTKAKDEKSLL